MWPQWLWLSLQLRTELVLLNKLTHEEYGDGTIHHGPGHSLAQCLMLLHKPVGLATPAGAPCCEWLTVGAPTCKSPISPPHLFSSQWRFTTENLGAKLMGFFIRPLGYSYLNSPMSLVVVREIAIIQHLQLKKPRLCHKYIPYFPRLHVEDTEDMICCTLEMWSSWRAEH